MAKSDKNVKWFNICDVQSLLVSSLEYSLSLIRTVKGQRRSSLVVVSVWLSFSSLILLLAVWHQEHLACKKFYHLSSKVLRGPT